MTVNFRINFFLLLCIFINVQYSFAQITVANVDYNDAWSSASWLVSNTSKPTKDIFSEQQRLTSTDSIKTSIDVAVFLDSVSNYNGYNISCFGASDGYIWVEVIGGLAPYTYKWAHGDSTAYVSGLSAGNYSVTVYDNDGGYNGEGHVYLDEPSELNTITQAFMPYGGYHTSCPGAQDGGGYVASWNGSITNDTGVGPYIYNWSNGYVGDTLNNVGAGVYDVTTTDANGCSFIAKLEIHDPPLKIIDIKENVPISCMGGNNGQLIVELTGSIGSETYIWNNGATGPTITGLSAGTYTVTVSDAYDCSQSKSYTLDDGPSFDIDFIPTDPSCGGSDGQLIAIPSGGTPPYTTYNWSNGGSSNDTLKNLSAGNYRITIYDGVGCTGIDSFDLVSGTFVKQVATGAGTGTDWDNALGAASLKSAIEAGGTVYVGEGTYSPGATIVISDNTCPTVVHGGFPNTAIGYDLSGYDYVANPTIIDGGGSHQIFFNSVPVNYIELQGILIRNANSGGTNGSAFNSRSSLTNPSELKFTDLIVENSTTSGIGTFYVTSKTNVDTKITFTNCFFNNNSARSGAGIAMNDVWNQADPTSAIPGNLIIDNCNFTDNVASTVSGGALWLNNSYAWTIRNSNFCNNSANNSGGAIYLNDSGNNVIENSSFDNNSTTSNGGAIHSDNSSATITTCLFTNNFCDSDPWRGGGAINGEYSSFQINNTQFFNNLGGSGGAIFSNTWYTGDIRSSVTDCVFSGNQAKGNGTVTGLHGGGAMCINSFDNGWDIDNSLFISNNVPIVSWGGAIANNSADITLTNSLFYNNLKGGNPAISGSDIKNFNNSGGFSTMGGNKMQLNNAALYTNQAGTTDPSSYAFTGTDSFSNTDDGSIAPPPIVNCGSISIEVCNDGIDNDQDGFTDCFDSECPCYTPFGCDPTALYQSVRLTADEPGEGVTGDYILYQINQSDASFTFISNLTSNGLVGHLNALAYNPIDGFIYGIKYDGVPYYLYRINALGQVENRGAISGLSGSNDAGAMDQGGNYFVTGSSGNLYLVNTTNLSAFILNNSLFPTSDIAINPLDGTIYAWRNTTRQLYQINPFFGTSTAIGSPDPNFNFFGSMFFNSQGDLFAYGDNSTIAGTTQESLVKIDATTGIVTSLATGTEVFGNDGCSCANGVELTKMADSTACPGYTFTYTFTIFNQTGVLLDNIIFSDTLTNGLTYDSDPYGISASLNIVGNTNGLTEAGLVISSILPGLNTFQIDVLIPPNYSGPRIYGNNSYLSNLTFNSPTLLDTITSDDPRTTAMIDPTEIFVQFEVCDNGIDDDCDGLIDCEDDHCYSTALSGIPDNDSDGISDHCDLDDDNDGILDTDEGCGNNTNISGTIGLGNNVNNASSYILTGTNITYTRSGVNEGIIIGYDAGIQGSAIRIQAVPTANGLLSTTFSNPISSVSFKLTDFDNLENYTVNVYDENGVLYDLTLEGVASLGSLINQTGNQFVSTTSSYEGGIDINGNDPADDYLGAIIFYFQGNVSRIDIIYQHPEDSTVRFTELSFCSDDTDGDNVFNHMDLDSDNDGIYDVFEAGHTAVDVNLDGAIDGVAADFGINGFFDALETAIDNGISNYTIADSETIPDGNFDPYDTNADDDACFDAREEDITDADDDGIAGTQTGSPIVDQNGLVTTITYAVPENNTWIDPLSGLCVPEICDDGIDNDSDGLIDDLDPDCCAAQAPVINKD